MTLPNLDAIGITYRQLDYWTRNGYLRAERDHDSENRTWPPAELDVAERMGRAIRAGLTPAAAHKAARGQTNLGHGVTITIQPREPTP